MLDLGNDPKLHELRCEDALSDRITIFYFNPADLYLWTSGTYFSNYFRIFNGNKASIHHDRYLTERISIYNFIQLCQPVAPVNIENQFYAMIFSCIAVDALSSLQRDSSRGVFRQNRAIINANYDSTKYYWVQLVCFIQNIFKLLIDIQTCYPNHVTCNSSGEIFGLNLRVVFPNSCPAQSSETNFSYDSVNGEAPSDGGSTLIINPFGVDLYFFVQGRATEQIILPCYSIMQVSRKLKIGHCANFTCETFVYFTAHIVPDRAKFTLSSMSEQLSLNDEVHNQATIRLKSTGKIVFSKQICQYSCSNYLCFETCRNHYPYCETCLRLCIH